MFLKKRSSLTSAIAIALALSLVTGVPAQARTKNFTFSDGCKAEIGHANLNIYSPEARTKPLSSCAQVRVSITYKKTYDGKIITQYSPWAPYEISRRGDHASSNFYYSTHFGDRTGGDCCYYSYRWDTLKN